MVTQSPLRILAIVARPEDMTLAADGGWQRSAVEGVDVTVIVASLDSEAPHALPGICELVLLNSADEGPHRTVCGLVNHLRRIRPQVVLTLQPEPTTCSLGHLATTAVLLAADVRFGHTCTTRPAHTVSKLYYLAADTGTWYAVLNTVEPGATDGDDLFAGLGRPTPSLEHHA